MKYKVIVLLFIGLQIFFASCKKDWLDAKPDQSLVTLNSIKDLQALLDNTSVFNIGHPITGEQSSDNYYVDSLTYISLEERDRNVYTWASAGDFFAGSTPLEWNNPYLAVFYANTVLEEIDKIQPNNNNYSDWANVKGSALFFRAYSFYNLAQLFCNSYIPGNSNTDPGIILRLDPDINVPSNRQSIQKTYEQIISDLLESASLLPKTSATFKTRPTFPASLAMISRVYLSMEDYENCLLYSDSCLSQYGTLMNYSTDPGVNRSTTAVNAIARYNDETIFHSRTGSAKLLPLSNGSGFIDTVLFSYYSADDWRRQVFFRTVNGRLIFRGSYDGSASLYNGLATDEIYLNRAECYARKGNVSAALQDLNRLLQNRYKEGTFTPIALTDPEEVLKKILLERRKELCFRMTRWTDLRRLNHENRFAITLKRNINGIEYTLPPNDARYVLPIPNNEIIYSNIPQNPR